MRYYSLWPQSPGSAGPATVFGDRSVHPPEVLRLQVELDCWPADDLMEVWPCYVVTRSSSVKLQEAGVSGAEFDAARVVTTQEFGVLHPDAKLPDLVWLKVHGTAGEDDFGRDAAGSLVVSERALQLLTVGTLDDPEVSEYHPGNQERAD